MTANQIVIRVAHALDQISVPYMLVGSYSSNVYGIPRSTQDADFVIQLPPDASISPLAKLLEPDLHLDPQLIFETITGNLRYVITHQDSAFKVELFILSSDAHHLERFSRRVKSTLDSTSVWFQSGEDVVIQKIRWYARAKRQKDRDDVIDVLETSGPNLDLIYIRRWCDEHGTRDLFEQLWDEAQEFQ